MYKSFQFICILLEFIGAYLAALLCVVSLYLFHSRRLMSVYWARTRAEDPGSGELRPGLRVSQVVTVTQSLLYLVSRITLLVFTQELTAAALLLWLLYILITRTSTRGPREEQLGKSTHLVTLNTFQTTGIQYWPKINILYLEYNLFLSV